MALHQHRISARKSVKTIKWGGPVAAAVAADTIDGLGLDQPARLLVAQGIPRSMPLVGYTALLRVFIAEGKHQAALETAQLMGRLWQGKQGELGQHLAAAPAAYAAAGQEYGPKQAEEEAREFWGQFGAFQMAEYPALQHIRPFQPSRGQAVSPMEALSDGLGLALARGWPAVVSALLDAGAELHLSPYRAPVQYEGDQEAVWLLLRERLLQAQAQPLQLGRVADGACYEAKLLALIRLTSGGVLLTEIAQRIAKESLCACNVYEIQACPVCGLKFDA